MTERPWQGCLHAPIETPPPLCSWEQRWPRTRAPLGFTNIHAALCLPCAFGAYAVSVPNTGPVEGVLHTLSRRGNVC